MRMRFNGYGRISNWQTSQTATISFRDNGVSFRRGNVTEWYINSASGLEQGFTIQSRPHGNTELLFTMAVEGSLTPRVTSPDTVTLTGPSTSPLRYTELQAWDASGHALKTTLRVSGQEIQISVDDSGASYPITVDPVVQQAKLTAPDGTSSDDFGYAVAASGNTALVGAFGKNQFTGAAYVYINNSGVWSEQAKLTASDGTTFNNFGTTLALSGNTALVGAFENNGSTGAAYVFVRNGTTWTQQAKLTALNGQTSDEFGFSVALDGNTAVIGAPHSNSLAGAAYVFARSGTSWRQQTVLTATDGGSFDDFGAAVGLNGGIAAIGARNHLARGAVYVFVQNGTTWPQQAKLTASDGALQDEFGDAIAVSGATVLVGSYNNLAGLGAAYAFVQNGIAWTQQAKITALGGLALNNFGAAVALSGDVAIIGAPFQAGSFGSAYLFIRSAATWVEQAKISAADGTLLDQFGSATAFSGNTAIVGAPFKNNSMGAAYAYSVPLVSPSPQLGKAGATITLQGSGFAPNETVYLLWASPHTYLGPAVADSTGAFSGFASTVPSAAKSGLNTIYGQGATSRILATGYFTVQ